MRTVGVGIYLREGTTSTLNFAKMLHAHQTL